MKIKLKLKDPKNTMRIESDTNLKEIMINEDFLHPQKESKALCFKDNTISGIIEITPNEFEKLYKELRQRVHLMKGLKGISSGGGAIRL